jgi:hypothetical protein
MGRAERSNPKAIRNLARWEREGALRNASEKKSMQEKRTELIGKLRREARARAILRARRQEAEALLGNRDGADTRGGA